MRHVLPRIPGSAAKFQATIGGWPVPSELADSDAAEPAVRVRGPIAFITQQVGALIIR